ncbi:MarR family winged helix-turn-helix transcriptional regulator [Paracidobacterium acidisoli]|uniref:MarR family transcriptional regulator n=1 Tax=Paracidobacterium acidisoli TaxID=2303751 RepID=A0A372IJ32_9BACT|nr:MarR family transcriptional regulator [Paracidobacterium acidisoli]MBT9333219.1 MarR family transcriptional regulator [Paracidobacterium acidisoli]
MATQNQSGNTTDTRGIHLWLILRKASRTLEAHAIRNIAALGMGVSDFAVLEALLHKGPLTVKEIGARVLLTSGSMTAAIDRLAERGLVERTEDAEDRRARVIRLTSSGRALIRRAFRGHEQAMEQAVASFACEDRVQLIDLLRRLGRSTDPPPH